MTQGRKSAPKVQWGSLLTCLRRFYATGEWRVPVLRERSADPYRVMVSTVLSHRTRDEVTERAALRLLDTYPTPSSLAAAPLPRILKLIREVGLAESKAKGLQESANILVRDYGGRVPSDEHELARLPLVGRKTASAILVFGYGKSAIPADTHIHRVVNRLGVVKTTNLVETSRALESVVPRKFWHLLNPTLVQHGQNICKALRPRCSECPISESCRRIGVGN